MIKEIEQGLARRTLHFSVSGFQTSSALSWGDWTVWYQWVHSGQNVLFGRPNKELTTQRLESSHFITNISHKLLPKILVPKLSLSLSSPRAYVDWKRKTGFFLYPWIFSAGTVPGLQIQCEETVLVFSLFPQAPISYFSVRMFQSCSS